MRSSLRWALAFLGLTAAGCSDPERAPRAMLDDEEMLDGSEGDLYQVEVDEAQIIALSLDYQTHLERLTEGPELSETHADAAAVQVWGTPGMGERFHSVDPDDPSQSVTFPERTHIVKEHLDTAGQPIGMTVMYKASPGYNPVAGDWFWARIVGETVTHVGRVDFCLECHSAAINSDFVVGFGKSE